MKSVTFTPASVKSKGLAPLHRDEKRLKSCMCYKIVYYVPRQSSVDVHTRMQNLTSEPGASDCLGAHDTLSEIRKRKRKFFCRGTEVKFRLIVLRSCTCGVISHLNRNKLDVAERGEGGPGGEGSGERSGGPSPPPPPPPPPDGDFPVARRGIQ